jgi:hypothetical protein
MIKVDVKGLAVLLGFFSPFQKTLLMDMGVGTFAFTDSENLLREHVLETDSATYLLDVRRTL